MEDQTLEEILGLPMESKPKEGFSPDDVNLFNVQNLPQELSQVDLFNIQNLPQELLQNLPQELSQVDLFNIQNLPQELLFDPDEISALQLLLPQSQETKISTVKRPKIETPLKTIGIAGMLCTNAKLDLLTIHYHMRNSYYHSLWQSLDTSLSDPKCAISIYQRKGNIVSFATKTEEEMELSLQKMVIILRDMGYKDVKYSKPLVINVIQSYSMNKKLKLEDVRKKLESVETIYIPSQKLDAGKGFTSLSVQDRDTGILTKIFPSGTLVFQIKRGKTSYRTGIKTTSSGEINPDIQRLEEEKSKLPEGSIEIENIEKTILAIKEKEERKNIIRKKYEIDLKQGDRAFTVIGVTDRIYKTFEKITKVL